MMKFITPQSCIDSTNSNNECNHEVKYNIQSTEFSPGNKDDGNESDDNDGNNNHDCNKHNRENNNCDRIDKSNNDCQ